MERYIIYTWATNDGGKYRKGDSGEAELIMRQVKVHAQSGNYDRIMVTDSGDFCAFEWKRGEGVLFPEELKGLLPG